MTPLIDTHLHLIYPDLFSYPWMKDIPAFQKHFTLDDYAALTKNAGVEAALFMEVDVAENDSVEESRFFMEQAEAGAYSLCGVIAAGRPEHEDFEAYLDSIVSPRLKGIRRVLHVVDDRVSQSPIFRKNILLLADRRLPFDICMLPPQHHVGIELVDACPQTCFVIDHCGNPAVSDPEGFETWQKTLRQFAEREQVNAKLSGLVAACSPGTVSLETVKPYLDATLEAFGPERLVWGSDWPVCTLTSSLPAWIQIFRDWLNDLSEHEQAMIAHKNARSIYSLD